MNKILLISEDTIKTNSFFSDNIFGKYLLPAISEAQEIYLQGIIGECLYKKVLGMVSDGSITASTNEHYKVLLDNYIQPFLLYQVQTNLVFILNVKADNMGTVISKDEYIQTLSQGNIDLIRSELQIKTDHYAKRMMSFLLDNSRDYELDVCSCNGMRAHLDSAANTGIFLGGYRGKHSWKYGD